MDNLIRPNQVGRCNTCASSADIESFGEFYELHARGVGAADENRHLQADAGRASGRGRATALLLFLKNVSLHQSSLGTKELVRNRASGMPE
jgi:hypothetical protein